MVEFQFQSASGVGEGAWVANRRIAGSEVPLKIRIRDVLSPCVPASGLFGLLNTLLITIIFAASEDYLNLSVLKRPLTEKEL
jgi:hypothetical protein